MLAVLVGKKLCVEVLYYALFDIGNGNQKNMAFALGLGNKLLGTSCLRERVVLRNELST